MSLFRLAINMPGAVSAGAYTAGVLDFLTEALDGWYEAKGSGAAAPGHDVSIAVFSGASAGGMCAAISAVMLQDQFDHIRFDDPSKPTPTGTSNRLYESWVNRIDIRELLKTDDLTKPGPVVSLLDSTIIEKIAEYALTRGTPLAAPRPYVAGDLRIFLSLTNLRGVPYSLNGVAPGSVEETTFFYGDRIRFETVSGTAATGSGTYALDVKTTNADFKVLKSAAMATGAFPVFLAPRVLARNQSDYTPPLWESATSSVNDDPPSTKPSFPTDLGKQFETLNVDGGVTDNDPFDLAHDYLASLAPARPDDQLETDPRKADRAVLSIAPFPTVDIYRTSYDTAEESFVLTALRSLFSALISQSRFFGESLSRLMQGTTFSHFVVAPSDDELLKENKTAQALQCGTLGAFGGFFARAFRAHDYALGRRNCQRFLQTHFILPADNVVMKAALDAMEPELRDKVLSDFEAPAPKNVAGVSPGAKWLPIIPLCTPELKQTIPRPARMQMTGKELDEVVDLMGSRFKKLTSRLIDLVGNWGLRIFLRPGPSAIAMLARNSVRSALAKALGDQYRAGS